MGFMYSGPAVLTCCPCACGPAASMFMERVKGEDRSRPALDLLWITKVLTKKSSLHVNPIPVPPLPGRFALNTHLTFCNFLPFFLTRGNTQQDKPQEEQVTEGMRGPKWGQQKLQVPKVPGWWFCAQGRSQLEHLCWGASETTPWAADIQAWLFLLFSNLSSSFRFSAIPVITVLVILLQKHLSCPGEQFRVQFTRKHIDQKSCEGLSAWGCVNTAGS